MMRAPCNNCIDPEYCNGINGCQADILLEMIIRRGEMHSSELNDDEGWIPNNELSDLAEPEKINKKKHEPSGK